MEESVMNLQSVLDMPTERIIPAKDMGELLPDLEQYGIQSYDWFELCSGTEHITAEVKIPWHQTVDGRETYVIKFEDKPVAVCIKLDNQVTRYTLHRGFLHTLLKQVRDYLLPGINLGVLVNPRSHISNLHSTLGLQETDDIRKRNYIRSITSIFLRLCAEGKFNENLVMVYTEQMTTQGKGALATRIAAGARKKY